MRADVGPHTVLAVIRHGEGFRETLAFVVAGARPHRVHVPPVGLHLRMDQRVAVTFRRRSHQVSRAFFAGQFQHAARADGSHVQRFDGMLQIVLGAGWRSHVHHTIDGPLDGQRLRDVPLHNKRNRGSPRDEPCVRRFPVRKLSRATTLMPIPQRQSHMCDPMNPAAPETDDRKFPSEKPYSS